MFLWLLFRQSSAARPVLAGMACLTFYVVAESRTFRVAHENRTFIAPC